MSPAIERLLSDVRTVTKETQAETAAVREFLDTLRPLKFSSVALPPIIRPPGPQYEVVMPGMRAPDFSEGGRSVSGALKLVGRVSRRSSKKTFGRGQLKIV